MATITIPDNLRELREQEGKTAKEVNDFLRAQLGTPNRDLSSVYQMENDGTDKYSVIRGACHFL